MGEYFAHRPVLDRQVHDIVLDTLDDVGTLVIDYVDVGVLIKGMRSFVELRPRKNAVGLSIVLGHRVEHPRLARVIKAGAELWAHVFVIRTLDDIDGDIEGWLIESHAEFGE